MRNILVVIVVALLPAASAAAEPSRAPPKNKAAALPSRLAPAKHTVNACAAYGAGFVKIDGTDTCVKIGGAVSIGVGGAAGSR
jgi:hypothetical protein